MSIAYVSNGTGASGASSPVTPSHPVSLASGDLELLLALCKYANRTLGAPAGFNSLGSNSGGAGTDGTTDEGQVKLEAWTYIAAGGESGAYNVTATGGTNNMLVARPARFTRGGSAWDIGSLAKAAHNTGGNTVMTFNFDIDPGFVAGDYAILVSGHNTDNYSVTAATLSIPGCTLGTLTTAMASGYTDGADARLDTRYASISSGTSSGAATATITSSGSATNSPAGAALLIRLREVASSGGINPEIIMRNLAGGIR